MTGSGEIEGHRFRNGWVGESKGRRGRERGREDLGSIPAWVGNEEALEDRRHSSREKRGLEPRRKDEEHQMMKSD